ncbi:hypothetical protein [Pedobacter miscanthi]|uniref:Uncharacterized protein n=1 Tax=Pedobacter miscanthi TaxID=2259170 RepID=A0A366KJQ6_9SPHI|nr:hypothetical protein [Pedobacter miscanthi]RBQ01931.1 hypothetical protein DRW42_28030 [Pedobacter miscanthi]
MKKHLIIRISILVVGFLLIYLYDHWDSWFDNNGSIGGNSGMSVPIGYFLNLGWIFLWCLYLLIEIFISYFRKGSDKTKRMYNAVLIVLGIMLFIIYNMIISH